jgi:N-acylneuraminate cytidylyltransferase
MILSVITARGGSKGIPGKNIKILAGKPLFIWSLEAAVQAKADLVCVSSDSPDVEKITHQWIKENQEHSSRVYFLKRPENIATDLSKSEMSLIHAASSYFAETKILPDFVVMLQPTSPIRKKGLIDKCIDEIIDLGKNSLMTVSEHTPFFVKKRSWQDDFDPYTLKVVDESSPLFFREKKEPYVWYYNPQNRPMRQELTENDMFYHDDGNVYVTRTNHLFTSKCHLDNDPVLITNDKYSSCQIDTEEDFIIVENIMKHIRQTGEYV